MSVNIDLKYGYEQIANFALPNHQLILRTAGKYCEKDIRVNLNPDWYLGEVVNSISITTAPTKVNYTVGESIDLAGIVVTDNLGNIVTADCSFSPAQGAITTLETTIITVSYGSLTTTQSILVEV